VPEGIGTEGEAAPSGEAPAGEARADAASRRRGARRTASLAVAGAAAMAAVAAASPPLYRMFCAATGIGGTPKVSADPGPAAAAATAAAAPGAGAPDIRVRFSASVADGLEWDFAPEETSVLVPPGERRVAWFSAANRGEAGVVGSSTFNVTPLKAAKYLHKVDCFCFHEQPLGAGESARLDVSFFVDPHLLEDPETSEVRTLTLAYTFHHLADIEEGDAAHDSAHDHSAHDHSSHDHGAHDHSASGRADGGAAAASGGGGLAVSNHPWHLVEPSPWPLAGAAGALALAAGLIAALHGATWLAVAPGAAAVAAVMFLWWRDVSREAADGRSHTPVVELGLRYGMLLFILSEVMFFFAFFWAWFEASFFAGDMRQIWRLEATGGQWPPVGIKTFDPFSIPFLNTLILLLSGTTVTWAHAALREGRREEFLRALAITIALGACFTGFQIYEYAHAAFGFTDTIYASAFYMATGFHGFHVLVGTIFLAVCLARARAGAFSPERHFGFEAAAWYWHFVDVVWLFLFVCVYWIGAGAPAHLGRRAR